MQLAVIAGRIPRYPSAYLHILFIATRHAGHQYTQHLRVHGQQAAALVVGHVVVLFGQSINQRFVGSRHQCTAFEVAAGGFGSQAAHDGVQTDFGQAAVIELVVLAKITHPVKTRRSKGVGQRAGQGIAKIAALAKGFIERGRGDVLQRLVGSKLADTTSGAQAAFDRHLAAVGQHAAVVRYGAGVAWASLRTGPVVVHSCRQTRGDAGDSMHRWWWRLSAQRPGYPCC